MKRILFWASGMFALGEVAYLYADRIMVYGIALAMSVCLVLIFTKRRKYLRQAIFLCVCVVCGFLFIMIKNSKMPIDYKSGYSEQKYFIESDAVVCEVNHDKQCIVAKIGNGMASYKIIVYQVKDNYSPGDYVSLNGNISQIEEPTNPGVMDMRKYYAAREILFSSNSKDIQINMLPGRKNYIYSFWGKINNIRGKLIYRIQKLCDADTAGFLISVLLGDKDYLDDDTEKLFQLNGISHILVISGLHISLLGGVIYKFLGALSINKNLGAIITIITLIFYGNMAGAGYATMRAVMMLITSIVGDRISRDYDMLTAMSLALLVMMLANPFCILDGGMVLSFTAILGVSLGKYIIKLLMKKRTFKTLKKKRQILYYIISGIIMSASVNIMLTPVMCGIYYGFPLFSLLLNIIVTPLMSIVVILGIAGLLVPFVIPVWGMMIIFPIKYIYQFYICICRCIIKIPIHYVNTGKPSPENIIIYYLIVLFSLVIINPAVQRKIRKYIYSRFHLSFSVKKWSILFTVIWLAVSGLTGSVALILHSISRESIVAFVDVGQGDGTFIRTEKGINMVIDGGSSDNEKLGEYVIAPMLKYYNMARVDYWFVSHGDTDHISGLLYVLREGALSGISIENIVLGCRFMEDDVIQQIISMANEQGINIITMYPGNYLSFDGGKITCLAPDMLFDYEDKNQASMALLFSSADVRILFAGDTDSVGIDNILESGVLDRALSENDVSDGDRLDEVAYVTPLCVLKLPHHGSKYSVSEELYSYFSGGIGIISCGENNRYGHPHRETMERLEEAGIAVYRTDELGAIEMCLKDGRIGIVVYGKRQ